MLFASDILLLSKALNQLEYNVEKEAVIALQRTYLHKDSSYIDEVTIRWKINHLQLRTHPGPGGAVVPKLQQHSGNPRGR